MLAANNERQFAALCGFWAPGVAEDPRWIDPGTRAANQVSLRKVFEKAFGEACDTVGGTARRGRRASQPGSKVERDLAEGQPQARGMLQTRLWALNNPGFLAGHRFSNEWPVTATEQPAARPWGGCAPLAGLIAALVRADSAVVRFKRRSRDSAWRLTRCQSEQSRHDGQILDEI